MLGQVGGGGSTGYKRKGLDPLTQIYPTVFNASIFNIYVKRVKLHEIKNILFYYFFSKRFSENQEMQGILKIQKCVLTVQVSMNSICK